MKQNKTAILVLLALVALMICAGILYSRLSSGFSMDVISSEAADPSASEEELTPAPTSLCTTPRATRSASLISGENP